MDPINQNGMPAYLQAGLEKMSGQSLENVRVSYNSLRVAQLGAQALTEGNHIQLAPGAEKHLAHEAWHVVQQGGGNVQNGGVNPHGLNAGEADRLAFRADQIGRGILIGL